MAIKLPRFSGVSLFIKIVLVGLFPSKTLKGVKKVKFFLLVPELVSSFSTSIFVLPIIKASV